MKMDDMNVVLASISDRLSIIEDRLEALKTVKLEERLIELEIKVALLSGDLSIDKLRELRKASTEQAVSKLLDTK